MAARSPIDSLIEALRRDGGRLANASTLLGADVLLRARAERVGTIEPWDALAVLLRSASRRRTGRM